MIKQPSRWDELFDQAMVILDQVGMSMETDWQWSFGGGTALMLQINHRLSYDVDFFSDNPQHLGFIHAIVMDQYVNPELAGYRGDGSVFVKLDFTGVGQIDFVITKHILEDYGRPAIVRGREVFMETIPEIIAKKMFHRGDALFPRDVFDLAAACHVGKKMEIMDALMLMPAEFDAFARKLSKVQTNSGEYEQLLDTINIMPDYAIMRKDVLAIVQDLVDDTRARLDNPPASTRKPPPPKPRM